MPSERFSSRINTQMGESVLDPLVQALLPEVRRVSNVFLSAAARTRSRQPIQEWMGYCLTGRELEIDPYGIHKVLSPDDARTWRLLIAAQDRGLPNEVLSPAGTAEPRVKIWRAKRAIEPYKLIIKYARGYKLREIE